MIRVYKNTARNMNHHEAIKLPRSLSHEGILPVPEYHHK